MHVELLTVLCAGLFAGAAIYINLVEHPARMSLGTAFAVKEFGPSYHRAAVMQASLAVFGLAGAVLVWWRGSDTGWLIGGLLLGSVVPFTLIAIMPTNRRLFSARLDPESDEARRLLNRWNTLHGVRSVLGASSFLALLRSLQG